MTVDLNFLLLALILLWFPRHWFRRVVSLLKRRRRSATSARITDPWKDREPGRPKISPRTEFSKLRNYLDLCRASAGSVLIMGGFGYAPAVALSADAPGGSGGKLLVVRCGLLLVGLLIQAVRFESNRLSFYPPIFFIAGLSLGLGDHRSAALAFISIWAFIPLVAEASVFLTIYAGLIVGFSYFFGRLGDIYALYSGVLCFLPVLLSMLARRPLAIYAQSGARG